MKKPILLLLLAALLWNLLPTANAAEATPTQIYTVEDLRRMGDDPMGSYILMEDLDMTGIDWVPLDFSGTFDGNGHGILNLKLTQPGLTTATSYDGNQTGYDTQFVGLFGILKGAAVKNLQLMNVRAVMEVEEPTFLGGIAGYCDDSTITGCTGTGSLELRSGGMMYGVGGVAGYGLGSVDDCRIDVTLITVDTDETTRGEQFLGGVYATGFIHSRNNEVNIQGYISEYGYVHAGGLVGLYMQQPLGRGVSGRLTGNTVKGKITFFEHNEDRRAYCTAYAGETLAQTYIRNTNKDNFQRKEIWNDTTELRPCACEEPAYREEISEAGCHSFGYTTFTCQGCGYSFRDNYTLHSHSVTRWDVTVEATYENEGISTGSCNNCGKEFTRTEPKLDPPETEPTEPQPTQPPEKASQKIDLNWQLPTMLGSLLLLLLTAAVLGRKRR